MGCEGTHLGVDAARKSCPGVDRHGGLAQDKQYGYSVSWMARGTSQRVGPTLTNHRVQSDRRITSNATHRSVMLETANFE